MTTRRLVAGYLALMSVASTLYFVWPSSVAVMVIGLGSAGAIIVGLRRYRPHRARSWLALAAALLLNAIARVVADALPGQPGVLRPWVWVVWTLHLVMAVLLVGGVIGMARATIRGVAGAIDAAIIALGTGLVAALVIAIPYSRLPGTGVLHGGVRTAYVLRDVLILAAGLLLVTAVRRSVSVLLLFTGLVGLLTYDFLFRVGRIRGVYLAGTAIDLGWLLFFVAIGTAALLPSMVATGAPRRAGGPEVAPLRLVPVAVAALLPTALLLTGSFRLPVWSRSMIIGVASVVLILVFARMVDIASRLRRQVNGERVLREAIADLADVQDVAAVDAALDRAVRRLLPPGADHRLVVAPPGRYLPVGVEPGHAEPCPTATLLPAIAAQLGDVGFTLAIPLIRSGPKGPSDPGVIGSTMDNGGSVTEAGWPTLLVRSDRRSLSAIRPRLDVLATEAALALERIALHEQVIRHTSETYFRTLVQNSTDVILIVDDDGLIRYASPSAETVLGSASLPGLALPALVQREDRATVEHLLERARSVAGTARGPAVSLHGDWTVPRPDRDAARVEVTCLDLRQDPSVGGIVVTLRDVTEQRHLERELIERALRDPLTGLGNRLAFSDRLEAAVGGSTAATGIVAALFVDLDDMKVINDGLGHDAGDALLRRMGERLGDFVVARAATEPGMVARLGGDEFAVLLTGMSDQRTAEAAATQLVATLSRPVQLNGHEVTCTASVGVATTAADVDSSAELLRRADLALYAAKASGKAQSWHYQPWMRTAVMDRLELRSALEQAITRNELFLEFQPIVGLESLEPVGFEALLRCSTPSAGASHRTRSSGSRRSRG
jgi:diguanylate cyclase (GGDEF)-like protein/PAS domain S-box-containing protein